MMKMAVLIKNGSVVDPANEIRQQKLDVLLLDGRVARIGPAILPPDQEHGGSDAHARVQCECEVFDASGCVVCPGLVDMHVHCFPGGTPLGVDPDRWCLPRGVTTVMDAGSAGAATFSQFLGYCKSRKTRVLSFIHASRVGLKNSGCATVDLPGELECLDDVNEEQCLECIRDHRDTTIVGVKVRLSSQLSDNGKNEEEALRRALSIASKAGLPLMVHYSFSTVPHCPETESGLGVPSSLGKGSILTHAYHGFKSTIIDTSSSSANGGTDSSSVKVHPSVLEAKKRGVLLDIGHGMGGFSWTVAEIAIREGIWPDTISTDHHTDSVNGPAYDLPTVMSKMLHLGMPLYDVIRATTITPASVARQEHVFGSLSPGLSADVAVLRVQDCDVELEDCQMQVRRVTKRLVPVAVWREGERVSVSVVDEWPNRSKEYVRKQRSERDMLLVKDN